MSEIPPAESSFMSEKINGRPNRNRAKRTNLFGGGLSDMSRMRRTHHAAGDALVSLMQERPYRSITVEEVLSRADISRSTFYTHFDGKDDLLNSHYTRFFEFIAKSCMQRNGDSIGLRPWSSCSLTFLTLAIATSTAPSPARSRCRSCVRSRWSA